MLIFTQTIAAVPYSKCKSYIIMIRKITLVFLLFIGMYATAHAAAGDSVTIHIPPYTDTTCFGAQLRFTETDTFTGATVKWYANNAYTSVALDTFYTTALADGDSVYCWLYLSTTDSTKSNTIVIHRAASIPARVLVSLTMGSNPDCAGHATTFTAYPVNGGTNPTYQWYVNGVEVAGADSISITRIFGGADTLSCRMVSNSPCAPVDTVFSTIIPIIHIHLTANVVITAWRNPVCMGTLDTLTATAVDYGSAVTYQWYIDSVAVLGAVNAIYLTDSLHNGDSVFCVITTTDSCVLNPIDTSNMIHFVVDSIKPSFAHVIMTEGTNPGCIDSPVAFKALIDSFGTAPSYEWYINGIMTNAGFDTLRRIFNNLDIVTFKVRATAPGCYAYDSLTTPGIVLIRDTMPNQPLVSLWGNLLVTPNPIGVYRWYFNTINSYAGATLVAGATGYTYHPTVLGYYFCIQDDAFCVSIPSNIIYISLLSINDINKQYLSIYPNPTNDVVVLDWGTYKVTAKMDIYNTVGQNVRHSEIAGASRYNADLSDLPNGNYYIVLKDAEGNFDTHTVVVNHKN